MRALTLSVIIPTTGQPSLRRTLASVGEQELVPGDEVLLVCDGRYPEAAEAWRASGLPGECVEIDGPHGDWGSAARTEGLSRARGDFIAYMDDDDIYAPGAFETVRAILAENPELPHMFRMRYGGTQSCLWRSPEVEMGNVGTPMFLHPNGGRWGRWGARYECDFDFIASTAALFPRVVWREEVIAIIRPPAGG